MLYTLNLYTALCQLYLNKNWKKNTTKQGKINNSSPQLQAALYFHI